MKRVFLFRFFLLFVIVSAIFLICKYGFYREAKVSFPNCKVELKESSPSNKLLITTPSGCTYPIDHITDEQIRCFCKNHFYHGKWYEMHLVLHAFFWIFVSCLFIYYFWSCITLYGCLHEKSGYFRAYSGCDICQHRCNLYNSIAEYDLTPAKIKWNHFWGY